jgi:hypothetical protein
VIKNEINQQYDGIEPIKIIPKVREISRMLAMGNVYLTYLLILNPRYVSIWKISYNKKYPMNTMQVYFR